MWDIPLENWVEGAAIISAVWLVGYSIRALFIYVIEKSKEEESLNEGFFRKYEDRQKRAREQKRRKGYRDSDDFYTNGKFADTNLVKFERAQYLKKLKKFQENLPPGFYGFQIIEEDDRVEVIDLDTMYHFKGGGIYDPLASQSFNERMEKRKKLIEEIKLK